jgi:hypothetical protein
MTSSTTSAAVGGGAGLRVTHRADRAPAGGAR